MKEPQLGVLEDREYILSIWEPIPEIDNSDEGAVIDFTWFPRDREKLFLIFQNTLNSRMVTVDWKAVNIIHLSKKNMEKNVLKLT